MSEFLKFVGVVACAAVLAYALSLEHRNGEAKTQQTSPQQGL